MNRCNNNIDVIEKLKNGKLQPEEVVKYSGWGGLKSSIYNPEVYRKLKSILTDDEIESIKKTLSNAYYTPDDIVKYIYQVVDHTNVKLDRVLEPAAGIGAFLPELIQRKANDIIAVELDIVSSKLLESLYPTITVKNTSFESLTKEELGGFDLIIGNPPFGREAICDISNENLNGLVIHHYFFAKCIDLLNDNGLLAMVLPRWCLDNYREHARKFIDNNGGKLLAAFRLPDDFFSDAKVTIDLVFFTKSNTTVGEKWLNIDFLTVKGSRQGMNEYYIKHPSHIIGELDTFVMYEKEKLTCKRNCNIFDMLNDRLSSIPVLEKTYEETTLNNKSIRLAIHEIDCKIAKLKERRENLLDIEREVAILQKKILLAIQ